MTANARTARWTRRVMLVAVLALTTVGAATATGCSAPIAAQPAAPAGASSSVPPTRPAGDPASSSAGCTASQLRLGPAKPESGEGDAYFEEVFLRQPLRNTGPTCRLVMPDHLAFTTDRQASAPVFVYVVGQAWYRIPHGASRLLSIGVTYPPYGRREPYCPHPLTNPTAVIVPVGPSSLTIDVAGLWKQRSIWPQVCRGPEPPAGSDLPRVPTISLAGSG